MGNSQSSTDSPASRARSPPDVHSALPAASATAARQRNQSPSSTSASRTHTPHRSLRYKKRSLELPDLAPRPLTPVSSHLNSPNASPHGPYRRPKASSPIPIPVPGPVPVGTAGNVGQSPYARPSQLPSTTQMADVLPQQPSTHIPIYPPHHRQRASYARSQYPSTRSFLGREVQANGNGQQPQIPAVHMDHDEPLVDDPASPFVAETIRSTIPVGLVKLPPDESSSSTPQPRKTIDEPREPIPFQIAWHGGGKSVFLARAGDANWKGRLPMEKDPNDDSTFTVTVSLRPGTHHVKFVVDDEWRVADDLPTAVDDDGSLANYVDVSSTSASHSRSSSQPSSITRQLASTPPRLNLSPPTAPNTNTNTPSHSSQGHQISFWSDNGTQGSSTSTFSARWTSELPQELIAAAREEEIYLSPEGQQSFVPAPNIPPAPILPRHLDKLILNYRPSPPRSDASAARAEERSRHRSSSSSHGGSTLNPANANANANGRLRSRTRHSNLGMTSTNSGEDSGPGERGEQDIPVTTASGTDVSAAARGGPTTPGLSSAGGGGAGEGVGGKGGSAPGAFGGGPALADDASVLPVPNHVVLHHLSTSAIKNGVLAVGNTTRYKKKFITTIYYKPT